MKRFVGAFITGALAVSLTVSASAQTYFYFGGGVTKPVGEFGDYAKTGWMGVVGANTPVGAKGLSVGAEVLYGSNKHTDVPGDKTNLPGLMGYLQYRAGDPKKPGVYVFGTAGALNHQFRSENVPAANESEWGFAAGAGIGVDIPVGGASLWVDARFITRSGTNFIPIMGGVAFPIGKKK